jgi:hypothetical protein
MNNRVDLANWVALLSGLATNEAGNMTTSHIRVMEIGLDHAVDDNLVKADLDVLCELLETANELHRTNDNKEKKELRKIGKVIAFFFGDWFRSKRDRNVIAKWVSIIGRLRKADTEMYAALSTKGAQNLTSKKIELVLKQVDKYLEESIAPDADNDSDGESQ